ncbi:PREDICTED: uncharacterized protein LOC102013898 [Chinchilla lanigera]|uniref:uncharacterized protein LOC102013898 n=1 Tax=Chinchilla lanigera TaxID=34839 RepID=UPI00069606DF|nr:PREDICTED: uncharacterized protein LOC102013898 [Chinchilla lanigera]XP_013374812.1 PREDICTED: uncharacterized protein LOC102013898 [Chinchilla lanigera]
MTPPTGHGEDCGRAGRDPETVTEDLRLQTASAKQDPAVGDRDLSRGPHMTDIQGFLPPLTPCWKTQLPTGWRSAAGPGRSTHPGAAAGLGVGSPPPAPERPDPKAGELRAGHCWLWRGVTARREFSSGLENAFHRMTERQSEVSGEQALGPEGCGAGADQGAASSGTRRSDGGHPKAQPGPLPGHPSRTWAQPKNEACPHPTSPTRGWRTLPCPAPHTPVLGPCWASFKPLPGTDGTEGLGPGKDTALPSGIAPSGLASSRATGPARLTPHSAAFQSSCQGGDIVMGWSSPLLAVHCVHTR